MIELFKMLALICSSSIRRFDQRAVLLLLLWGKNVLTFAVVLCVMGALTCDGEFDPVFIRENNVLLCLLIKSLVGLFRDWLRNPCVTGLSSLPNDHVLDLISLEKFPCLTSRFAIDFSKPLKTVSLCTVKFSPKVSTTVDTSTSFLLPVVWVDLLKVLELLGFSGNPLAKFGTTMRVKKARNTPPHPSVCFTWRILSRLQVHTCPCVSEEGRRGEEL